MKNVIMAALLLTVALPLQAGDFERPVRSPHTVEQEFDALDYVPDKHHTGVDYTNTDGKVRATSYGTVVRKQVNGLGCATDCNEAGCGCTDVGFGNALILEHQVGAEKIYSMYAHMASFKAGVNVGTCVYPGEELGTMGGSGFGLPDTWGTHLHFELKNGNTLINPSGSGSHFGYTPTSAINYGFLDPSGYIVSPADQLANDCHPPRLNIPLIIAAKAEAESLDSIYGTWEGTWYIEEMRYRGGPYGSPPYDTPTVQLTIHELDDSNSYGDVLVGGGYSGQISTITFDNSILKLSISYPDIDDVDRGFVTGVVVGTSFTGRYDEPEQAEEPDNIVFALGPLELTKSD